MKSIGKITLVFFLLLIGIAALVAFLISFKKPALDRDWSEDQAKVSHIQFSTSTISVDNIRDFRYASGTVISKGYYSENFDPDNIRRVYFLLNPFGAWQGVGHTFFVFAFNDGASVAVSVEGRREKGEVFGAVHGLLNDYELWYGWGSAADFLSRRATYYGEELDMYPLDISTSTAKGIFIDLAQTTHQLETAPAFYNTLFTNCAEVLVQAANRVNPGAIRFTFAEMFPGFADDKLYELGLIPHDKPFAEINMEAKVDSLIRDILKADPKMGKKEFFQRLQGKAVLK